LLPGLRRAWLRGLSGLPDRQLPELRRLQRLLRSEVTVNKPEPVALQAPNYLKRFIGLRMTGYGC
jgi:hypothetical protein